ncbi:hypothetical protein JCM10450v2_003593 [Rhodotorula kratochvilovae]
MSADPVARLDGHASLAALPQKLKERIVAHLDELALYDDDEDWEDESTGGEGDKGDEKAADATVEADDEAELAVDLFAGPDDQRRATLSALSLVNKEWYALVAPRIWKELYLYARSTESLLELVQDILPRQASHVKQLTLRETQFDTLLSRDQGDALPLAEGRALEVVEAAEKLVELGATSLEWELRCARARDALLKRIVETCANVVQLDIEGPLRILRRSTWDALVEAKDDDEAIPVEISEADVPNTALKAIKALRGRVEGLALLLPPDGISKAQDAVDFFEAFPDLKSLELNFFLASAERDEATIAAERKALLAALAGLAKLEELRLGSCSFINDELADAAIVAPLKHLAMDEFLDLSFAAFTAFVSRFSSTLESLELDGTPVNAPEQINPLDLPKLVALELSTPHEASILALFAKAPLREVFLRESPQLSAKDVVAFLEAHEDTLREFDLEEDAIADGEGAEGDEYVPAEEVIGQWCEEHGIEFALVDGHDIEDLADSDSEDEEEGEGEAEEK